MEKSKLSPKKQLQIKENETVLSMIECVNEYFRSSSYGERKKLRSCSAYVYVSDRFFLLQSYHTIVAAIDREDDTLYDFLRYVYGYTSTSAQHIAKFQHDYCAGKWSCASRFTYRDV